VPTPFAARYCLELFGNRSREMLQLQEAKTFLTAFCHNALASFRVFPATTQIPSL
jgi:hypothetical protein